jgi:hypothetical protein
VKWTELDFTYCIVIAIKIILVEAALNIVIHPSNRHFWCALSEEHWLSRVWKCGTVLTKTQIWGKPPSTEHGTSLVRELLYRVRQNSLFFLRKISSCRAMCLYKELHAGEDQILLMVDKLTIPDKQFHFDYST